MNIQYIRNNSFVLQLLLSSFLIFLSCDILFIFPSRAIALDITPDLIFQQMEEKTEKIFSIIAEVELSSGTLSTHVTLSIQSPDKFAMDFEGNRLRVVFDGERLWLYIEPLAEVFTLDTSGGGGWLSEALRQWINPKEIVTHVTRKTLFSFFDVTMLDHSVLASIALPLEIPPERLQGMCFKPIVHALFQRLFDVGYYYLVFSMETYLPVMVREYAPDGSPRGMLRVVRYRINEQIPKERFIFETPPGVREVPISEVIAQKIEQSKEYLANQIAQMLKAMRRKLTEWGF